MLHSDMLFWQRQRLHDSEKRTFPDDGHLTSALNVAAYQVQAKVMRVAPDVFRKHWFRDLLPNVYRYQLPRGFIRPKLVMLNGVMADPGTERGIETGLYGSDPFFNITGGEIVISPKPETTVDNGLHVLYVPVLSLSGATDDLQDQGLVEPLHMAVVLWAVKLLMPEGGEENEKIDAEILSLTNQIPEFYGTHGSGEPLEVVGFSHEVI